MFDDSSDGRAFVFKRWAFKGCNSGVVTGSCEDNASFPFMGFVSDTVLRSAPFEPLCTVSLKFLTWKTFFFCLWRWVAKVCQVFQEMSIEHDGFLPELLAKNPVPGSNLQPVCIKPLSPLLESDDVSLLLCPVRALSIYLKRSRPLRQPGLRRLFVSVNTQYKKDVTKNTLAGRVVKTIRLAYQLEGLKPVSTRAHELRA